MRAEAWLVGLLIVLGWSPYSSAGETQATQFHKEVQPLLVKYCYDCHGDGEKKGGVAFDEFKSDEEILAKRDLWWNALKNVRAGIMPPKKKPRPTDTEQRVLENWIKYGSFGIDAKNPDPGRVTLRRLNRVEYRNTIHDLMGFDFKVEEEFPPDDSGYGFDNIGDVLTISPLLLEKYMQAAESIVAGGVPTIWRTPAEKYIAPTAFKSADGSSNAERMTFFKESNFASRFKVDHDGDFRIVIELYVSGEFDFDPGRCNVSFKVDDKEQKQQEFGWSSGKRYKIELNQNWQAGEHIVAFELTPIVPVKADAEKKDDKNNNPNAPKNEKKRSLDLRLSSVKIYGPLEEKLWVRPKNFEKFFTTDDPKDENSRRKYAHDVMQRFASKAFRRPVDEKTVERLVSICEAAWTQPGKRFEEGLAQGIVAVLASPRFLFRVEGNESTTANASIADVDEYALASRLSYFLWSTMPDDELMRLAERGELRKNLSAQMKRMLADTKSQALVDNFTGQWLQARDVDGINIDARIVLVRDAGQEKELRKAQEEFRARLAQQAQQQPANVKPDPTAKNAGNGKTDPAAKPGEDKSKTPQRPAFNRLFAPPAFELDDAMRRAMRAETQMTFSYILHDNRSVTELLDADYTFVNEKLAKLYGIPDVKGTEMRRVTLAKDSPRGGVLTQGSVLVVTSNPTRTSPVKRGLFILDNVLGLPPPPPPADIPQLEEAEKKFKDKEPTLREVLAIHREKALCSSCHSRMDPLGLALENFNALGQWRDKERGQAIESAGILITGESFNNVRELKKILIDKKRADFYRCLTEKMLTYALGRGLEYYDVEAVDQIVDRLEKQQGHISALLMGVVESAPFQKRRNISPDTTPRADRTGDHFKTGLQTESER